MRGETMPQSMDCSRFIILAAAIALLNTFLILENNDFLQALQTTTALAYKQ